jgi:DNA-binding MarR family transcriptional regulator
LSCYDIIRGMKALTLSDYESLAELRYQIRCFLSFSEQAARAAGIEPRQHQLMLSLKGLPRDARPTIGELAERLQIQHHSAVELVNRLAAAGFIRRSRGEDRREVLLELTSKGEKVLRELSLHHREELRSAGPTLVKALRQAMQRSAPSARSLRPQRTRTLRAARPGPSAAKYMSPQDDKGDRVAIGRVSKANGKRGSRLHVEEHKRRRNGRGLTAS